MSLHETYEAKLENLIIQAASHPLDSERATAAIKNLKTFSEIHTPEAEPEPPTPETRLGRIKQNLARALDNETARVAIKAIGAFAGVATVTWATIHRDHNLQKEALGQANRNQ